MARTPGRRFRVWGETLAKSKKPAGAKPSGPPRPVKNPRKTARRQKLAAGLIAGKSVTKLAKETGLSRSHASREANAAETKLLIHDLLLEHQVQVRRLVEKSLTAIEEAFSATRMLPARDAGGNAITVEAGEDHFARLTASKRVIELLEAARPDASKTAPEGAITYEMFLTLRQQYIPSSGGPE